jgi:hypothetical protein
LDEYFTRAYVSRNTGTPNEMHSMTDKDHVNYVGLVREWSVLMNKTNHTDPLMQITAVETREELKVLRKKYPFLDLRSSVKDYQLKRFRLLEWSKYRYIMCREIFDQVIESDHYKLSLNGQEIIFDYYSLTHILTRHYGHIMKTYETDKSHFTKDILHTEIHSKLDEIFKQIDASHVYTMDSVEEINIRLNGTIYKIFCGYETKYVSGHKGAVKFLRLNSFFPTENTKMLKRLDNEYEEKTIDGSLSVFVRLVV